jgi:hypothetical protein
MCYNEKGFTKSHLLSKPSQLWDRYSVFEQFRQVKFAHGDSNLSSSQIFDTAPAASINDACYKSGQN